MQPKPAVASICGTCAHWRHLGEELGLCRLLAPWPGETRDEVAHWPATRRSAACGEWRAARPDAPQPTSCGGCRHWRHHQEGIDPVDRRDQLPSWWSGAGHCMRHAPRPAGIPGHRAFWRATNAKDGCFEGAPFGEQD